MYRAIVINMTTKKSKTEYFKIKENAISWALKMTDNYDKYEIRIEEVADKYY